MWMVDHCSRSLPLKVWSPGQRHQHLGGQHHREGGISLEMKILRPRSSLLNQNLHFSKKPWEFQRRMKLENHYSRIFHSSQQDSRPVFPSCSSSKRFYQATEARGAHHPCLCFILRRGFWSLEIHSLWRDDWVHLPPSLPYMSSSSYMHTLTSQVTVPNPKVIRISTTHRPCTEGFRNVHRVLWLNSVPIRSNFWCSALISTKELSTCSFSINNSLPYLSCKKSPGSPIIKNSFSCQT